MNENFSEKDINILKSILKIYNLTIYIKTKNKL